MGMDINKTCHNSQRAVACTMFNLKILIKIVSRPAQVAVRQSTLKPNNEKPKSITTNLNNLVTFWRCKGSTFSTNLQIIRQKKCYF